MPTYAVTGATGPLGALAVRALLDRGAPAADVVAIARTPERAADLAALGVTVRRGDYSDPSTLPAALDGVDRLLLVSGNEVGRRVAQHRAVAEAAKSAGVGHLLYTSLPRADVSGSPLAPEHRATEEVLRDSGLTYAVLRNNWYYENYTAQLPQYRERGEVVGFSGAAHIGAAARPDLADAAAAALLDPPPHGAHLELSGPGFTLPQLAAAVTAATGTTVAYRDTTPEELAAALRGTGLDEGTVGFLVALEESTARGDLDVRGDDLERLLGRRPVTIEEALRALPG